MQGRRTFEILDLWLRKYVGSAALRTSLMIVGLLLVHVVVIALVGGVVELATWLLG